MFFILLFLTTLVSIFLYTRTSQDIFGVLAVAMTIACLIWGLVIAHWSFHLLALLALLFFSKPMAIAITSFGNR